MSRARTSTSPASADPATVGLHADDGARHVDGRPVATRRPSSRRSSPARRSAIVPPGVDDPDGLVAGGGFVGSGGYRRVATDDALTSQANPHYWAGPPAIATIQLVTRPRRPQPGRGVRGRRPRLRADRAASTRRGSPTTATSARSCARSPRCRLEYSASTRASRRSTTSGSARRSRWRSTGAGSPASAWPTRVPRPRPMVPPGIPGRSDARLLPDARSRRGPGAAGRGRLSRAAPASRR